MLMEHPDLVAVTIVGLPDPTTGERACAVIVPRCRPGPNLESIEAYLRAQGIATFRSPSMWRSGILCRRTTPARCSSIWCAPSLYAGCNRNLDDNRLGGRAKQAF
jgi:acyl-CoA synthetase (AMP-forming)/AMP-acid ligase II